MTSNLLRIDEAEVIQLIVSYLEQLGLHAAAAVLERESGCIYSGPVPELKLLLLRGRWLSAKKFVQGLPICEMIARRALFEITKQKYIELVYIYHELKNELLDDLGNAIAICFSELSVYCEDSTECEKLRNLASIVKFEDHSEYRNWNPYSSRKECFNQVCLILKDSLNDNEKMFDGIIIPPRRLLPLLIKGILYESSEEYCRQIALCRSSGKVDFLFGSLMEDPSYHNRNVNIYSQLNSVASRNEYNLLETYEHKGDEIEDSNNALHEEITLDTSLYSWLQSVPWVSFTKDFVFHPLTVNITKLLKPQKQESWTEVILECTDEVSGSSIQNVKEAFWNEKISKNFILNAPEILTRAEDVVTRWEAKNKLRKSKNRNYNLFESEAGMYAKNEFGERKVLDRASEVGHIRRKSIFTFDSSKSQKPCGRNQIEGNNAAPEPFRYKSNTDTEMKEQLLHEIIEDKNQTNLQFKISQFHSKVDEEGVNGSVQVLNAFTANYAVTKQNIIAGIDAETMNMEYQSNEQKTATFRESPETERIDDTELHERDKEGILNVNNITEKLNISIDTRAPIFDQNAKDHFNVFTELENLNRPFKDSIITEQFSQKVTEDNFYERKKYITGLLEAKDKLRSNLLHILTHKECEENSCHVKETGF